MKNQIIIGGQHSLFQEKENFISYLDVSNGTLITYGEGLKSFFEYLSRNNIKNPSRDDIKAYRDSLKGTIDNNTVNNYLTAVRRFFKYLEINNIYSNITKDIKNLKTSNIPKKQVLTLEQTKDIYSKLTNVREKCLFSLAITTGLRGIEIANARIEDIQTYNGEIVLWVQCKGHDSKDEYVKLSDIVLNDIKQYIDGRTSGYIFVSQSNHNKGGGVTTKTLRLEIKNIFKRFGLDSNGFSLHSTRRTSATIAYTNGADIKEIQQMLHHKSILVTSRYINQMTRDNNKTEYNISNVVFGN